MMASSDANLGDAAHHTECLVEELRQVAVITQRFETGSQATLNTKLHSVVDHLKALDELKESVAGVHIPLELVDLVDQGKNPMLFSKSGLESALKRYEVTSQKKEAFSALRAALADSVEL